MKKAIIIFVFCCLVLTIIVGGIAISKINLEVTMGRPIYIDIVELDTEKGILNFIPLPDALEVLGSIVICDESTGDVYFDYLGENYICQLRALNPYFPEKKNIMICKIKNKGSIYNKDYIQLNSMSADGAYRIINDKIYLYQESGQRLLEALGCKVEVDFEQKKMSITKGNK